MKRRPTQQDITWFLDINRNKQLDLEPPYQRRSVWTLKERKLFLDTIFRQYPCPPIFLHQTKDDEGRAIYHVVDGKQRIETIIKFTEGVFPLGDTLNDLGIAGSRWKDIDSQFKRIFWDYIFTVEFLDIVEGVILDEVFTRINTNSKKLERQELRHAKYDGWFARFVEAEAEKKEWSNLGVVTTGRAKRMKDIQFLSELFLILLENQIVGFDQDYLDNKYAEYDNPQENHPNFSEDEFVSKLEEVKSFVASMEASNRCVTRHAKSLTNFFSLWSVVALNKDRLGEPRSIAVRYDEAMNEIEGMIKTDFIGFKMDNSEHQKAVAEYARNSLGASTDLQPRLNRLNALKTLIVPQ